MSIDEFMATKLLQDIATKFILKVFCISPFKYAQVFDKLTKYAQIAEFRLKAILQFL